MHLLFFFLVFEKLNVLQWRRLRPLILQALIGLIVDSEIHKMSPNYVSSQLNGTVERLGFYRAQSILLKPI